MTIRNELNSWREKIERNFEGVFFASASIFFLAGVLTVLVQPALVAV